MMFRICEISQKKNCATQKGGILKLVKYRQVYTFIKELEKKYSKDGEYFNQQTTAFQKLIMLWKFAENNYQQPSDPKILDEINYIIDLQDQ